MRILCDRCKKQNVDFNFRNKWAHIEFSEKGYGKLGDYYLCPECASDYYKFIGNETVIGGEAEDRGKTRMTNREYMIGLLSSSDFVDDGRASYEAMVYYNINCPYSAGDERGHCSADGKINRENCFSCKEIWLDSNVDE